MAPFPFTGESKPYHRLHVPGQECQLWATPRLSSSSFCCPTPWTFKSGFPATSHGFPANDDAVHPLLLRNTENLRGANAPLDGVVWSSV
jgi:hypothetical protein